MTVIDNICFTFLLYDMKVVLCQKNTKFTLLFESMVPIVFHELQYYVSIPYQK